MHAGYREEGGERRRGCPESSGEGGRKVRGPWRRVKGVAQPWRLQYGSIGGRLQIIQKLI